MRLLAAARSSAKGNVVSGAAELPAKQAVPSALQFARCFAAEPAAVQDIASDGKVTQVRLILRLSCRQPLLVLLLGTRTGALSLQGSLVRYGARTFRPGTLPPPP